MLFLVPGLSCLMYSRADLRRRVYDLLDWAPDVSPEFIERTNRALNTALRRFIADAPTTLFEATERLYLSPDFLPDATDTVSVHPDDAWVIRRDLPYTAYPVAKRWNVRQKWDGRHITIKTANGVWNQRQIRTVWRDGDDRECISLVEPWPNTTDEEMAYAVDLNQTVWLNAQVKQIRAVHQMQDTVQYELRPTPFRGIYTWNVASPQPLNTQGFPYIYAQMPPFGLQPPAMTPAPALTGTALGSYNRGTFDYRFTFVWGHRDVQQLAPGPSAAADVEAGVAREVPLFESPPGPVSAEIENPAGGSGTLQNIQFRVPAMTSLLAFDDPSTPRADRTGIFVRIYRRARNFSPGMAATVPDKWYFLDEVLADGSIYTDDGTLLPDIGTPLEPRHSYTGLCILPRPGAEQVLVTRFLRHVEDMQDDSSTPPLDFDGCEALSYCAAEAVARYQRNTGLADHLRARYREIVADIQKHNSSVFPNDRPIQRGYAVGLPPFNGWSPLTYKP